MPLASDVDLDTLACLTSGMTGADLANLLNFAAIRAATEGKEQVFFMLLSSLLLCISSLFFCLFHSLFLSFSFYRASSLRGRI